MALAPNEKFLKMNILYFIIILVCLVGIPYFCLIQRRRTKYIKIAQHFGGEYVSDGLFKTGKINCIRNGRKFSIETIEVGHRSAETHFRTFFSTECKNDGMLLLIKSKFFNNFPNWNHISKLREKTVEKDFIGKMLTADYKFNSYGRAEEYNFDNNKKVLIEKLLSNLTTLPQTIYREINKKLSFPTLIQIEREKVTLDIGGLLLDKDKIEMYMDLIGQIADSIEDEPVPL